MDGEKLVTMEGDVLRAVFRSELRSGGCYGEGRDKKNRPKLWRTVLARFLMWWNY